MTSYDISSTAAWAASAIRELRDIARNGVPACYADKPASWLYDFFPNLPWTEPHRYEVLTQMTAHPQYHRTVDAVERRTGIDVRHEIALAICESLHGEGE